MSQPGEPCESVILCEGYHDRAFWAEWLKKLRCVDPRDTAQPMLEPLDVRDPWGGRVIRGQFGFWNSKGAFIRVQPCDGKGNLLPEARRRLRARSDRRLAHLVLCVDADLPAGLSNGPAPPTSANLAPVVREFDEQSRQNDDGEWILDNGGTLVSHVCWRTDDPSADALPETQTLERLICAAIAAAYPARSSAVTAWLRSRPDPPAPSVKEFSWSHMAGWYAEHGCEDFYRQVWRDDAIAAQLRERLTACGAWRVAAALAGG